MLYSNINNAKSEVITKFTIVDFSSYIPNGSLFINTDKTLTIPGISNYQYIKCVADSDQLGGFAKIKSDGSFYSTTLFGDTGDNEKFHIFRVTGIVSGNTLTLKANGASGVGVFKSDGLGKPANYIAGDNYTITSILCLGKK